MPDARVLVELRQEVRHRDVQEISGDERQQGALDVRQGGVQAQDQRGAEHGGERKSGSVTSKIPNGRVSIFHGKDKIRFIFAFG